MTKGIWVGLILVGVLLLGGCFPGDPLPEDLYTKDVLPGTNTTYDIGSEKYIYEHGYLGHLHLYDSDPFRLVGDAKVWIEFRPDIDYRLVRAQGTPTWVERGAFGGFSLPIYIPDEELFFDICIPNRWDGESTTYVHLDVWIDTAQDAANDAFRLQISYNSFTPKVDIVPSAFTDVEVETTTGVAAQYQSFQVDFNIPAGDGEEDDILAFRIRRIDVVTGNEMDGEVVVEHVGVIFLCDRLGNPTWE